MVVAMAVMGVVQTAIHQIADMVAMRDGFVSASRPMDMIMLVTQTAVGDGRTGVGVRDGYLDDMLIHVIVMGMVQMAIVQIVHVIAVAHGRMTATGSVDMRMVLVLRIRTRHRCFP